MENQPRSTGLVQYLREVAAIEIAVIVFSFASFATIGLSLVVTSWIAAIEGSISLVGQLFFASSATSLVFSVYAGVVTDRKNRLSVIRQGQALRLLGVAALAVGSLSSTSAPWLFAYAVLFSVGTALNAGALDGIVQLAVDEQQRMKLSIRVSICRQVGILCGTGLGGVALHYFPAIWSVLLMVVLMTVQFVIISRFFADYQNAPSKSSQDIISAWKEGVVAILRHRSLAITILNVGLFFSASQMANVLVPGFVKDTLQRGSDVYGLLETAWAVGGGAILATAAAQTKLFSAHRWELVILIVVGLAMVVFAASRSITLLVVIYALLGGMFALGRAICDGRILILARNEEIGRVRAATSMVVSLLGMAIYISPTVVGIEDAIYYYVSWGILISIAGVIMLAASAYYRSNG
ncbi:MFS transporter [Agrobacterium vitis]|uniref:MFS transporter n=1 Tax=Agrobacterium vitis TaxID=373 RepID=UPI000871E69E|nr:MFS transporter [Agrobacterium vitis]NSY15382.1 MFS transporter [Agrobacterium vitis]NSY25139.1 MFS transporter [Agrobacterium vitis]NTA24671.1 MFS transporter [Agrobacterium vitis]WEO75086.1 MFS transporter [Agrobacterium vitis]